jgi:hypothetical protein
LFGDGRRFVCVDHAAAIAVAFIERSGAGGNVDLVLVEMALGRVGQIL